MKIIGRVREKAILRQLLMSNKPEFLALYGRRRVGKTFLVRNFFDQASCVFFHSTGIQKGKLQHQLEQFYKQIGKTFYGNAKIAIQKRWLDAFEALTEAMNQVPKKKKIVLFLDELPWMATRRSGLLQALEYYWNQYWSNNPNVKLVICGSASSWIIDRIINNKGGLYNRVTRTVLLSPFTLLESQEFLSSSGVKLNQKQLLDLYMVLGGVPHYLSFIERGKSATQCIDELFFQKDGALLNEFERLFASLFQEFEVYISIIRKIAKHRYGVGQAQLIRECKLAKGGRAVQKLKELEEAGFIIGFLPHGHQEKGKYFKIIDEFVLFYLHWVEEHMTSINKQNKIRGYWLSQSKSASWKSWAGYAFEAVCNKHLSQIRKALNIDPGAQVGSWRYAAKSQKEESGAQIDVLFDRPDGIITLGEIKHSEGPFSIDKTYAQNLKNKIAIYQTQTRTNKQIFLVMITSGGLKSTKYSDELITQQVCLNDLFADDYY